MKIIDLLNKIANGEEVPKKIKNTWIYEWNYDCTREEYCYMQKNGDRFDSDWLIESILNDEIEIIEEDKDIEELPLKGGYTNNQKGIVKKINELIKEVNKLKKEGD